MSPARRVISSILVKPASADCNLHCTYCFYNDRPTDPYGQVRGRHVMSDATLRALIRQGMRIMAPASSFGWQGGEPMLTGIDFFRRGHRDGVEQGAICCVERQDPLAAG